MINPLNPTGICCIALYSLLGSKVTYPSSQAYNVSLESYFSAQVASLHPSCIVLPEVAADVSTAVSTLSYISSLISNSSQPACKFAVRSGGHNTNVGASNIDNGVTIDLRGLNTIELSDDKSIISLGVGNTWDEVYEKLDGFNLSVAGGRSSGVGVGGLSLGGGISFFGTRYGWTSDAVLNFELVLANGSIINANTDKNPDLAAALRGGGNNFGIVTRVDMPVFQQPAFWGGFLYFPTFVWSDTGRQFVKINSADKYDENVHMTLSWGYDSTLGEAVAYSVDYTKSTAEPPAIFSDILSLPVLFGSTSVSDVTHKAFEQFASRYDWSTITLISTEAAVNMTYARVNESIANLKSVSNLTISFTLEPLPPSLYARHAESNSFGLGNREQSLIICLLELAWFDPADDTKVVQASRRLMATIEEDARDLGVWDPFVYFNYAGSWQDPISSYGQESVQKLRQVAYNVDPGQVFTYQVPGGFKIIK
ncbi:putative oxidoreductase [Nemania abortiva]|nr:putative oxidoreductase [Nemania abortiva]